ncbi:MAG: hypothetical protein V3U88_02570 [Methylococcales bacterium]
MTKERAWNNLNNDGAGFLLLTKRSQEAYSCSTQRLRSFRQGGQKDQPEYSSYSMRVPKQFYDKTGDVIVIQPMMMKNYWICQECDAISEE